VGSAFVCEDRFNSSTDVGRLALQVHGQAAFKLFLKSSPDGEETIIDDLKEVRAFMHRYALLSFPLFHVYSYLQI
jgi:hypothetical protein